MNKQSSAGVVNLSPVSCLLDYAEETVMFTGIASCLSNLLVPGSVIVTQFPVKLPVSACSHFCLPSYIYSTRETELVKMYDNYVGWRWDRRD